MSGKGDRDSPSLPIDTRGQEKSNKQENARITIQDNKIARFCPCTPTRLGCIHCRVCTGHAIPYTYLQMCGGPKITKVSFVSRRRLISSSSLCQEVISFFRSLQHPLVPRRPIVHLRCEGPYGSVNSECKPVVHRRAVRGSERLEVVLETIQPVLCILQNYYSITAV